MYVMTTIMYLVFHMIKFPWQVNIVTIDELAYFLPDSNSKVGTDIPFIGDSSALFENVGVGFIKDSSLMGTFQFPSLICYLSIEFVYVI
jgi:hypothetical protein